MRSKLMSALGHKQTCAVQLGMSAFVPKRGGHSRECPPNLRSKTIQQRRDNGYSGGDEAVFNAKATRGRRPSHSVLCC